MTIFPFSFECTWFAMAFVLGLFVYVLRSWTNPFREIPGPPGWPILGNTLEFTASTDQHSLLLKWAKQYGRVFKYYVIFGKFAAFHLIFISFELF